MIYARIRPSDGARQDLRAHLRNVSLLAAAALTSLGLEATAKLAGLLHDMGKGKKNFQMLLEESFANPDLRGKKSSPHSPIGAIYAYERWFRGDSLRKLTAQIISMAIYGHHAGLPDCLDYRGDSPYLKLFTPEGKREIDYDEAVKNFLGMIAAEELDALFDLAATEVRTAFAGMPEEQRAFQLGMLARLVLSALVDADRWDSACFARGADPFSPGVQAPDWPALLGRLEAHLASKFTKPSPLNAIRGRISDDCLKWATFPPGIYRLTVPTGGGKTFSTLRYALAHAGHGGMRRIFYIIPFNTILDQNAEDIRGALGADADILEHHSGVVIEEENEAAAHRRLTERWDSPIILTSMVQFLNALFGGANADARRMHALQGAVLIFDEVQALPKHCTRLFEGAIRFLTQFCGCTAVLCTATQPQLALPARDMVDDVAGLFRDMRRVRYVDESRIGRKNDEAAVGLAELMARHGAALSVVNTKHAAYEIYNLVKSALKDAACFHLSTNMCPAHRLIILEEVKKRKGLPTFLISTALIEAGINVSFPAVVRSLAGLSSIIQAGGRCNRNAEADMGTVYIWRLAEENLARLPEIRIGQEQSDAFLRHFEGDTDRIADPDVIAKYFEGERAEFQSQLNYPYPAWDTNLLEMLSRNGAPCIAARQAGKDSLRRLVMPQSFRTAGEEFKVIKENTRAILVPYGEGAKLIADLLGKHDMRKEIALIRKAQRFSVNLYPKSYNTLLERKALYPLGDTGIIALRPEFYDPDVGLKIEPGAMELLNVD